MMESSKSLILLVFATDIVESLKTEVEMQSLQSILEPVAQRLDYEVQILEYSTIDHFIDCLDDNRDRLILLHFAGHSNSELLQLDEGEAHAQGLARKLQACQHLQLLFLNGCSNAHQVQRFVEVGIPATIGTYYPINDSIACEFSEAFYIELVARQQPIASAFKQAKETISTKYGSKYHSLNVRSFGDENEDIIPKKWAWFLEQQTEEHDWKFEEAAHACNRLPILPPKTTQDLPDLLFKNLYYYQSSDADIFFGRCQATLDILTLLDNADFPLLLLHGGTGVGKSSFLMAGLIPRLLARQQAVNQPFRYEEQISLENLLPLVFNTSNLADIHFQLNDSGKQPSIWILDQVEEIFFQSKKETTLETPDNITRKEERQDSIPDALNLLLKTLKALFPAHKKEQWPNARIILTLRTEWFGELHDACRKYQLANQDYMLKPLDKADIIEIIEQPTKKQLLIDKYGLQIEKLPLGKLSAQIADDLLEDRESNIAPPLQIILSKLWQDVAKLPKQERIWTQQLYEQKKAQGLLLSEHLDHQLQEIGTLSNQQHGNWGQEANDSGLLIDILHSHTTVQGTSKTRSIDDYNIHYAHIPYRGLLARTFIDRYLLIDPSNERQQYRLAHDTLAKVVKAKYETSELPGQRARRILDSRSTNWIEVDDEFKGAALDKFDLKLVETGESGTRDWHQDKKEVAIIQKSQKKRRNSQFVFSGVIIGFIVAFLVTALLYFQAEEQRKIAQKQVLEANYQIAKAYEEKARSAYNEGSRDNSKGINEYRKSLLYALEAKKLKIPENRKPVRKNILDALTKLSANALNPEIMSFPFKPEASGGVQAMAYSPNGEMFATGAFYGKVNLWNAHTGKLIKTLKRRVGGGLDSITSLSFSPNGNFIAGASSSSSTVWNISTEVYKTITAPTDTHDGSTYKPGSKVIEYSPDGKIIAFSPMFGNNIFLKNAKTDKLIKILTGHKNSIQAMDYSPDGNYLISTSSNIIRLWDLKKGTIKKIIHGHTEKIIALKYHPNGNTFASSSNDKTIKLWNARTGNIIKTIRGHNKNLLISYSPTGKEIASSSLDKTIRLWNVETGTINKIINTGKEITSLTYTPDGKTLVISTGINVMFINIKTGASKYSEENHKENILSLEFSPDGSSIASGSSDKTIKIWNSLTGELQKTLKGHDGKIRSVAYLGSNKIIASASDDKTIKIWDTLKGSIIHSIENHEGEILSLSYNATKNLLASGSTDKTIKLWNIKTFQLNKTLKGHTGAVRALAFSPNGDVLASGSDDKTIKLWNTKTGKLIYSFDGHEGPITTLSYNSNGQELASGSLDKTVKIWDIKQKKIKHTLRGYKKDITAIAYSTNSNIIASVSSSAIGGSIITLSDSKSGKLLRSYRKKSGGINAISYSPMGGGLAIASKSIHYLNAKIISLKRPSIRYHKLMFGDFNLVKSIDISPYGYNVAFIYAKNKNIYIFDLLSGKIASVLSVNNIVTDLIYSPDGSAVAAIYSDNIIRIWDLKTEKIKLSFKSHEKLITKIAYSPDGKILASASHDKTVKLWNIKTGLLVKTLRGHTDEIYDLAYTTNGKILASASADTTIKFWDTNTGNIIHTIKAHKKRVNSIVFNIKGDTLASASGDQIIKLWDTKTWSLKQAFKTYNPIISSLDFSEKNNELVSASTGPVLGDIQIWDLETGRLKRTLDYSTLALGYLPDGSLIAANSLGSIDMWDKGVFISHDLLYRYSPKEVSQALQFLWGMRLNGSSSDFIDGTGNEFVRSRKITSLIPRQGYYYSNTQLSSLLQAPKRGETKADQLVHWLKKQCAYQNLKEKEACEDKKKL